MEVNTGEFEPHLNHVPRNSLIIYEFNIPHREITEQNEDYPVMEVINLLALIYILLYYIESRKDISVNVID